MPVICHKLWFPESIHKTIPHLWIDNQLSYILGSNYAIQILRVHLCQVLPQTTHRDLRLAFQTRYNITWISIHIRREDFHGLNLSSDDRYIHDSVNLYRRRYYRNDVRFLVASDDRAYCRKLFSSEQKSGRAIILPDHFSPADDLMALSLCHHSIVTAGTFGFWSAYLTGGDVIHDTKYKVECSRGEYYPAWFLFAGPM